MFCQRAVQDIVVLRQLGIVAMAASIKQVELIKLQIKVAAMRIENVKFKQ